MLSVEDWLLNPRTCPGFQKFELVDRRTAAGGQVHVTEYLHIKIPSRYALVNVTHLIEDAVKRSGVIDGLCFVSAMHITAGIYINDAESGLLSDIAKWIEALAPFGRPYKHHQTGEDNGDAHLKSFLTNHCTTLPVTRGKIDFGTWQQVFYAEYDGKRDKRILVKTMGI